MSDLTQKDIVEIEKFTNTAHEKYTGLIMDSTIQGRANSNSVAAYVLGRGLPLTMENLDEAVVALQFVLFWTAGNEPVAVPSDNRTRAQTAVDGGVNPYVPTHYNDAANGIESSWAKDVRLGKEKAAAQLAAKAKAAERFRETHQVVQGPTGRQNFAASNELNRLAAQRHAEEDARESGKPVRVTGFRVIPAGTTDFTGYSAEELKAHLARSKGRAGEPHGSLLR
jgi:hypothetical protein